MLTWALLVQRYEELNWGSFLQDLPRELQHHCNRYILQPILFSIASLH